MNHHRPSSLPTCFMVKTSKPTKQILKHQFLVLSSRCQWMPMRWKESWSPPCRKATLSTLKKDELGLKRLSFCLRWTWLGNPWTKWGKPYVCPWEILHILRYVQIPAKGYIAFSWNSEFWNFKLKSVRIYVVLRWQIYDMVWVCYLGMGERRFWRQYV